MSRNGTVSKLLKLKGITLDQLELEIKGTMDELDAEKTKLALIEDTLKNTAAGFMNRQNTGLTNIQEVELSYNFLMHLNKRIEEQSVTVKVKTAELDTKQRAISREYQGKRLFELMKDDIVRKEMKDASLREQKEIDFNYISKKSRE